MIAEGGNFTADSGNLFYSANRDYTAGVATVRTYYIVAQIVV